MKASIPTLGRKALCVLILSLLLLHPISTQGDLTFTASLSFSAGAGTIFASTSRLSDTQCWIIGGATQLQVRNRETPATALSAIATPSQINALWYDDTSAKVLAASASKIHQFTITSNAVTVTETGNWNLAANLITSLLKEPSSNFLFAVSSDGKLFKLDPTAGSIQLNLTTLSSGIHLRKIKESEMLGQKWVSGDTNLVWLVKNTDATITTTWTMTSGININHILTDNSTGVLILASSDGAIRRTTMNSNGTVTINGSLTIWSSQSASNMEKLFPFNYFMVTRMRDFKIVDQPNMTVLSTHTHSIPTESTIAYADPQRQIFDGSSLFYFTSTYETSIWYNVKKYTATTTIPNCTTVVGLTCTQCAGSYYIKSDEFPNKCVLQTPAFPTGYGIDGAAPNPAIRPCSDSNCAECQANYSICTSCKANTWKKATPTVSCVLEANIPDAWGKDNTSNPPEIKACAYCKDCKADFNVCVECPVSEFLDLTTNTNCYAVIPAGKGQVLSAPKPSISTCAVVSCKLCPTDMQKCDECTDNTFWLNMPEKNNCWLDAQIPPGRGKIAASSPQAVTACDAAECKDCKADKTVCEECKASFWLPVPAKNNCYTDANIPVGMGKVVNTFTVSACTVSNCAMCKELNTQCTQCNNGPPIYYLDTVTNANCYLIGGIPAGKGVITAPVNSVGLCSVSNCAECSVNAAQCTACATNYYVDMVTNMNCYLAGNIPDGKGIDQAVAPLRQANTCSVSSCIKCAPNRAVCVQCQTSPLNYLLDTTKATCATSIPAGHGELIGATYKSYTPCSVSNCSTCTADSSKCSACAPTYYFDLVSQANCYTHPAGANPIPTEKGIKVSGTFEVEACFTSNCDDCKTSSLTCTICKANYNLSSNTCIHNSGIPDGFGVVFGSSPSVLDVCTAIPIASPSRCKDCRVNHTLCTECISPFYLDKSVAPPHVCYAYNDIPAGKGVKFGISPNEVGACSVSQCKVCTANKDQCSECNPTYYLDTTTNVSCPNYAGILPGKGIIVGATYPSIQACSIANCIECKDNSAECTKCSPIHYLDLDTKVNCYLSSEIPLGKGQVVGHPSFAVRNCAVANCASCFPSKDFCTACQTSRYLDSITYTSCYLLSEIPDGKGINLPSTVAPLIPEVKLCQVNSCAKCPSDFTKCQECTAPKYLDTTDNLTCFADADIPTYKGKWLVGAPVTLAIRSCQVGNCKTCKDNSLLCTGCKDAPGDDFYLDESTMDSCVTYANIPVLKGIVPLTTPKKINTCTVTNCLACKDNRTQCTQCLFSGTPYWLDLVVGNVCLAQAAIDPLSGKGKVSGATPLAVNACTVANCEKCNENRAECTQCTVGYWLDTVTKVNCYLSVDIPNGKGKWIEVPPLAIQKVRACSEPNCKNCLENSTLCVECASSYYLDLATNMNCYLFGSIPMGKGVVFGNSPLAVNSCTRSNCQRCTDNKDKCMQCSSSYFIDTTNDSMCIQVISSTTTKGIILGATYPSAGFCNVNLCMNCWDNHLRCNECNANIWLDITNMDSCLVSIPDGKGPITTVPTKQIRNCTVIAPNCQSCLADSTICTLCLPTYYLDKVTNQNCYLSSAIPSPKGIVPSATPLQVNLCPANCQLCPSNNTQCEKCSTGFYLDLRDNVTCWASNNFPPSMGIKVSATTIPSIEPCITNCLTCTANSLECNVCLAAHLLNNLTKTSCYPENAIPDLLGEVLPTQNPRIVEACTVANCLKCTTNKTICDQCNVNYWLDLPAKLTCFADSLIPSNKGKVPSPPTPASVNFCPSNCLNCKQDNTACTNCDLVNNYWINDGVCVHGTAIPIGKGKKLGTGYTENCTVARTGCLKCFDDSTKCTECDQLNDYWLGGDICYTTPNIPDGRGKELLTGKAPFCSVTNCQKCAATFTTCTDCLPSYALQGNICALACTSPGCMACPTSVSVCTACNKSLDYWLENGACVLGSAIPAGKGRKESDVTVAACTKEFCKVCGKDFSKCETCQDNYNLVDKSCSKVEPPQEESNGWKYAVAGGVTGGAILIGLGAYFLAKKAAAAQVAHAASAGNTAPMESNRLEHVEAKKDTAAEQKPSEEKPDKPDEKKEEPEKKEGNEEKRDVDASDVRKARFVSQGTKTFIKYL